jgi:hypothetical protein
MGSRRAAVVLLLLVLPLGAAACGGGKKSSSTTTTSASSPLDAVRAAAEKTAKAGTMQLALSAAATGSTTVAVAGAGGFDTANHTGKLHLHFSTSGISGTLDVVLSGTDLYVSSPLFSLTLPAGKSWIKLDLTKGASAAGVDLSSLLSQDPSQALDALESASSVVAVGTVKLGSIVATHNTATVKKASGSTKAGGVYNVWVGQDGYIHRVRTTIAGTSGSSTGVVAATSTLSGFGQPVTVTVPPASQTVDSNGSIPGLGG